MRLVEREVRGGTRPRAQSHTIIREVFNDPLQAVLVAGALAYLAVFLLAGVLRVIYPFPLDAIESGARSEVQRILRAQPIYVAPTLEYVPFVYGPVYFYIAALIGPTFAALRVVSLVASCGSIALIVAIVRRETQNWTMALVGGGLLAACAPQVGLTLDSGRMDALALCFMLAAACAVQRARTWRATAVAGVLMALSILTKQTGVIVGLAMLVALTIINPRGALTYLVTLALTVGLTVGILMLQSGGWPLYYLWDLPRNHVITPALLPRFWDDLLSHFTLPLLLGPLYFVRRQREKIVFYGALTLGALAMGWTSRANSGGAPNVDLPAYAMLAILFALALHAALQRLTANPFRRYALVLGIAQFAVLITNPRLMVPYTSDLWAGQRLQTALSQLDGPIFAPGFAGYVDTPQPDLGALEELMGAYGGPITPEGQQWLTDYGAALAAKRYTYVIVDPDFPAFFVSDVARDNGYVSQGPLFPANDDFWRWRSSRTPQENLYTPSS